MKQTTLGEITAQYDRIYDLLRLLKEAESFAEIHKLSSELAELTSEFGNYREV